MRYTRSETDYETGEVFEIDIGEHLPFTETAKKFEVSRSTFTKAMLEAGLCQTEFDDVADRNRNRLHPSAVEKGLGYRIMGVKGPFDVLSPQGQQVAKDALDAYLLQNSPDNWRPLFEALRDYEENRMGYDENPLTAQMKVCWLLDHFGDIPHNVIAQGIGVSDKLVYRHVGIRRSQLNKAEKRLIRTSAKT